MLYQFLKVSFRNITRHKFFSAINIVGLMLSITICIPALMIIKNQLEFDDFHPHPDRTFRIITEVAYKNGDQARFASTSVPLAEALEEFELTGKVVPIYRSLFGKASTDQKTLDISGSFTKPAFFQVFGFELEHGDPLSALNEPYSIVLTQTNAHRFFGDENPVGETLSVEGVGDFTVTGILKELPQNTHLRLGSLASFSTIPLLDEDNRIREVSTSWRDFRRSYTYLLTKREVSKKDIKAALSTISSTKTVGLELGEYIEGYQFDVQTLAEISPGEVLRNDIGAGKARPMENLLMLMGIAFVILLMASFNYTNLSIARALKRAKEVGVYKVLGAHRWQIVLQFMLQSFLTTLAAMLLAYGLLPWIPLPPGFMQEVQSITPDLTLMGWFLGFVVFASLLAGLLPAWLLSSLNPALALKNIKSFKLLKGINFRKGLVVFQFTLSVVLLIVTTAIYQQSQYVASADYGFQRENMIDLELQGQDYQLLKDELTHITGIEEISATSDQLGTFISGQVEVAQDRDNESIRTRYLGIDEQAVSNLNLNMLAGANFSAERTSQTESEVIVNEAFLPLFNWENPAEAVGQPLWLNDSTQVTIAGVLQDFHYESMSVSIRPLVLRNKADDLKYLNIRYASASAENIKHDIEAAWAEVAPKIPIDYSFTDEVLYEAHAHKQDVASFSFYALIALVIASLGLLGMVTYTVEVRTQEVGVRKVLGASVIKIIGLLSKEFLVLLGIAASIGLPVGYWLGLEFITSYTYHINMGVGTLFFGIVILLLVGTFSIGIQTWKVATSNPVEALRSE